jgi:hypothetical protein
VWNKLLASVSCSNEPPTDDEITVTAICCSSNRIQYYRNDGERKDQIQRTQMIDEELRVEKDALVRTLKILLLGKIFLFNKDSSLNFCCF